MSTYHHGDLRSAVLVAAAKMLEKEGLAGLSVRAAARRAGVSHNAPYRHFPDRDALLAALAAEGFRQLADALEGKTGRELGEAYVRFALERPQRFRLMFGGQLTIAKHPALRDVALKTFAGLSGALAARVGDAPGARDASIAAWALVHGLAQLLLGDRIAAAARQGRAEEQFIRDVLGSTRFAAGMPSQPAAGAAQPA